MLYYKYYLFVYLSACGLTARSIKREIKGARSQRRPIRCTWEHTYALPLHMRRSCIFRELLEALHRNNDSVSVIRFICLRMLP